MIQLLELDPSDQAAVKAYRLQVKARLYRFNKVSRSVGIQLTFVANSTLTTLLYAPAGRVDATGASGSTREASGDV